MSAQWLCSLGLGCLLAVGCAGANQGALRADDEPAATSTVPPAANGSGARSMPLQATREGRKASADRRVTVGTVPDGAVTRAEIDHLLERGPGWLMSQIALEPVIAAGRRFLGFRLVSMFDDGPRVRRSGVKAGDIVQRVNGVALRTPDDLTKILAGLRAAAAIELKVLRDGAPLTLRLAIVDSDPSVVRSDAQ